MVRLHVEMVLMLKLLHLVKRVHLGVAVAIDDSTMALVVTLLAAVSFNVRENGGSLLERRESHFNRRLVIKFRCDLKLALEGSLDVELLAA